MTQTSPIGATTVAYAGPGTVEQVRLGFPMRFVADVIDMVVVTIVNVVVGIIIALVVSHILGAIIAGILSQLVRVVIVLAYFSPEVTKGQSPAKMMLKQVIRRQDGSPATRDQLTKRYGFKMAPTLIGILAAIPLLGLIFSLVQIVASLALIVCALMYLRQSKLALYDEWFGTAVYGPGTPTASFPTMAPGAAVAAPTTNAAPPPPAV